MTETPTGALTLVTLTLVTLTLVTLTLVTLTLVTDIHPCPICCPVCPDMLQTRTRHQPVRYQQMTNIVMLSSDMITGQWLTDSVNTMQLCGDISPYFLAKVSSAVSDDRHNHASAGTAAQTE